VRSQDLSVVAASIRAGSRASREHARAGNLATAVKAR
jgi:hypothetical protein